VLVATPSKYTSFQPLTGLSATSGLGSLTLVGDVTIIPTGQSMTSSVGTLDPADQVMGLTGLAATSGIGTLTIADQIVGLTGLAATASVGNVAPLAYEDITGTQSAGYSDVAASQSAGYSSVTATQNANYTAVND